MKKQRSEKSDERQERRHQAAMRKDPLAAHAATTSQYSRGDASTDKRYVAADQLRRATLVECEEIYKSLCAEDWDPRGHLARALTVLLEDARASSERDKRAAEAINQMRAARKVLRRIALEEQDAPLPQLDGRSLVDNAPTIGGAVSWAQRVQAHRWSELEPMFAERFVVGGVGVGALAKDRQRLAYYVRDRVGPATTWQLVTAVWLLLSKTHWPELPTKPAGWTTNEAIKHIGKAFANALRRASEVEDPQEIALQGEIADALRELQADRGKKKV
ncbi:MAG: hypothetical protein ABUL60_32880 [Myxococcales bacterium]